MEDYLLPLFLLTPLLVMTVIALCIWRACQIYKRIHGTPPFVPGPRFSNFMCTLLMPDAFPPKRALLVSQSVQARADIAAAARKMQIGIALAVALIIFQTLATFVFARPS